MVMSSVWRQGQCGNVLSMASGAVWSCLEYGVRGSVVIS